MSVFRLPGKLTPPPPFNRENVAASPKPTVCDEDKTVDDLKLEWDMALLERDEARLLVSITESRLQLTCNADGNMSLDRDEALWERDAARLGGDMVESAMKAAIAERDNAFRDKAQVDFERDMALSNSVDVQAVAAQMRNERDKALIKMDSAGVEAGDAATLQNSVSGQLDGDPGLADPARRKVATQKELEEALRKLRERDAVVRKQKMGVGRRRAQLQVLGRESARPPREEREGWEVAHIMKELRESRGPDPGGW